MIIVNYFQDEDYNPETDGYSLHLAGMVNDHLDLDYDINLIKECIDNQDEHEFLNDVLYEIHLCRATIDADPIPEPAFAIYQVVTMERSKETGIHQMKLVRL
jgi:hypothetical protein